MRASRTLPPGYLLGGTVTLAGNETLLIKLILASLPLSLVSWFCLLLLSALVRPEGWEFTVSPAVAVFLLSGLLGLLAVLVATLVLHEAAHALVMWAVTRSRPVFGFKGWYFYVDAPGWYLSRGQMVAVLAAPLILVPAIGLPLVAVLPAGPSFLVLLGMIVNNVVAVGDLYMIWIAIRLRGPVVFGDTPGAKVGESGSWYVPAAATVPG